jgi:fructose-1,6-bisphosphatase/inositol monophosphatase family enzyme
MQPASTEETWGQRLLELGAAIQAHLRPIVSSGPPGPVEPVAEEGGDTIYPLDRRVEPVLEQMIRSWPESCKPLLLIAEGMGTAGRVRFGAAGEPLRYRLIVDPIDGTRGLMYGKRSGWFLAAVAPDRGEETRLADTFAAVLVELPTDKQGLVDSFMAVAGRPALGRRSRLGGSENRELVLCPSTATTLRHGFGHVVSFFPGTKVFAAQLLERIVAKAVGELRPGKADVFDDQYISSGGQMVELMLGHDRFCCDLRPLFDDILAKQTGHRVAALTCHPYDIAGALVARQAGVILTDGFGRPLDSPLDVESRVHWCGYANTSIQQQVQPVVNAWLVEHGIEPG